MKKIGVKKLKLKPDIFYLNHDFNIDYNIYFYEKRIRE